VKGSASDDDDDPSQPKLADKGSEGKRNKKTVKPQTDSERVDEDLSVAKFYGQSGNFMGAYLRAKDAVKTQPDYAEAHFVLGEAARRLKKQDEAKAEFNEYLKLAPGGERAKAAEKALDELR
jgi:Flp pilus assembly protein TadD